MLSMKEGMDVSYPPDRDPRDHRGDDLVRMNYPIAICLNQLPQVGDGGKNRHTEPRVQ